MKRWNGVNSNNDAFPSRKLQVEFGKIVTLSTLKYVSLSMALNCSSLQTFRLLVLPTRVNTLDRSHHFASETFLNRHHYRVLYYRATTVKCAMTIFLNSWILSLNISMYLFTMYQHTNLQTITRICMWITYKNINSTFKTLVHCISCGRSQQSVSRVPWCFVSVTALWTYTV